MRIRRRHACAWANLCTCQFWPRAVMENMPIPRPKRARRNTSDKFISESGPMRHAARCYSCVACTADSCVDVVWYCAPNVPHGTSPFDNVNQMAIEPPAAKIDSLMWDTLAATVRIPVSAAITVGSIVESLSTTFFRTHDTPTRVRPLIYKYNNAGRLGA